MKCEKHKTEKQDLFDEGIFLCEECFEEEMNIEMCDLCDEDADESYNDLILCRNHYEVRKDMI